MPDKVRRLTAWTGSEISLQCVQPRIVHVSPPIGRNAIAASAAGIAKILFVVFLVLFAASLVMGMLRRGG